MSDQQQQQAGDESTLPQRSTPATTPPTSEFSDFEKGMQQVELELRLLEALAIYRPSLLVGVGPQPANVGHVCVLMHASGRHAPSFHPLWPDGTSGEKLLDRFFNLELLQPDEEELELIKQQADFSLPPSMFEEIKGKIPA